MEIAEALEAGIACAEISPGCAGTVCRMTVRKFWEDLPGMEEDLVRAAGFSGDRDPQRIEVVRLKASCDAVPEYTIALSAEAAGGEVLRIRLLRGAEPSGEQPLSALELDDVYELPYERAYHPSYESEGGVPALREVKFSLVSVRGCFGGCSFLRNLTFHQGQAGCRRAAARRRLLREAADADPADPDFKGYIHDVGAEPTANFRLPACRKRLKARRLHQPEDCLYRGVLQKHGGGSQRNISGCPAGSCGHCRQRQRRYSSAPASAIDYLLADPKADDLHQRSCAAHHVSGTLKVAPEHISDRVLRHMHKPGRRVFETFCRKYEAENRRIGKKQYLIPYFISSHPGCTLKDACELSLFLKENGFVPDQVQDFYPTPGTLSTCMFYTGIDPVAKKGVSFPGIRRKSACSARCSTSISRKTLLWCGKRCGSSDGKISSAADRRH